MPVTLQGIFQDHFSRFAQTRKLPLRALKAASAIMHCRTPLMGGHVQQCPQGHVARIQYHSCRHRSCAQCSRLPRAQWSEQQAARLLACDHYHAVFTLPHELLTLWEYNRTEMARALFAAAGETVMDLLKDPRFLGVTPGLLMALHTWGRTLTHHPHVHCLVTGGGLTPAGQWKAVTNGYLLPVRVVKALFRGKLLGTIQQRLRDRTLTLPPQISALAWARTLKALYKKNWNVCIRERYPHGHGVMRYLSGYVKGGPIGDSRLRTANETRVVFAYQDHRDGKHKTMSLTTHDFPARLLWHAPAPRQHTIRHRGLYSAHGARKRAQARGHLRQPEARAAPSTWHEALERLGRTDKTLCPRCRRRLVRGASLARVRAGDQNSFFKSVPGGFAQLGIQADTPSGAPLTETGPPPASDIFLRGGVRLN